MKIRHLLFLLTLLLVACEVGNDRGEEELGEGAKELTVLTCTGPTGSGQAVVCVDAANPTAGAGTTSNPYKTIQSAITAAKSGDQIQVAQGTYAENPVLGAFNTFGSKRLDFLGGFQSGSDFTVRDPAVYVSLIDGGLNNPGLRLSINAGTNSMTVEGFAIKRGKGIGTNYTNGYGHGGGLYVQWQGSGTLTLKNLDVYDNQTNSIAANSQLGGGLWSTTTANGAGTGRVRVEDSYFHNNKAGKGAAVGANGNFDFYRNRVEGNFGQNDHGGGFYLSGNGTFEDNLIKDNDIGILAGYGWGGGGAFVGGSWTLRRNVFTGNYAPLIGSGVFFDEGVVASMTGDLFYKNDCPSNSGAAIYVDGQGSSGPGSTLTATNITVADHACGGTKAAVFLERQSTFTAKNSIFWGNTGSDMNGQSGTTWSATYSRTSLSGTGNITADPQFVNAASNDYHLKSTAGHYTTSGWVTDATTSPAIDAGDPSSAYSTEPAPNGSRINMGFEGNTTQASKSATLDYEDCPGQPYTITLDASPTVISGNLSTSSDDQTACSTTSNDRVYKLNLSAAGGILHLSTDNGTLAVRTTCGSASGELGCSNDYTFEATATTYYVVVEGSGSFNLTVDYDSSECGDGFLSSTEECEPPTAYCIPAGQPGECTSTAPDAEADVCPGKAHSVSVGTSNINNLTTINYADDLHGSCSPSTGGDYVLLLTPEATGTLTVKVNLDGCEDTCSEFCWDVVLYARSTCSDDGTELDCVNDTFGGEEMELDVTEDVPVSVVVDGLNGGWYSSGKFNVQLILN